MGKNSRRKGGVKRGNRAKKSKAGHANAYQASDAQSNADQANDAQSKTSEANAAESSAGPSADAPSQSAPSTAGQYRMTGEDIPDAIEDISAPKTGTNKPTDDTTKQAGNNNKANNPGSYPKMAIVVGTNRPGDRVGEGISAGAGSPVALEEEEEVRRAESVLNLEGRVDDYDTDYEPVSPRLMTANMHIQACHAFMGARDAYCTEYGNAGDDEVSDPFSNDDDFPDSDSGASTASLMLTAPGVDYRSYGFVQGAASIPNVEDDLFYDYGEPINRSAGSGAIFLEELYRRMDPVAYGRYKTYARADSRQGHGPTTVPMPAPLMWFEEVALIEMTEAECGPGTGSVRLTAMQEHGHELFEYSLQLEGLVRDRIGLEEATGRLRFAQDAASELVWRHKGLGHGYAKPHPRADRIDAYDSYLDQARGAHQVYYLHHDAVDWAQHETPFMSSVPSVPESAQDRQQRIVNDLREYMDYQESLVKRGLDFVDRLSLQPGYGSMDQLRSSRAELQRKTKKADDATARVLSRHGVDDVLDLREFADDYVVDYYYDGKPMPASISENGGSDGDEYGYGGEPLPVEIAFARHNRVGHVRREFTIHAWRAWHRHPSSDFCPVQKRRRDQQWSEPAPPRPIGRQLNYPPTKYNGDQVRRIWGYEPGLVSSAERAVAPHYSQFGRVEARLAAPEPIPGNVADFAEHQNAFRDAMLAGMSTAHFPAVGWCPAPNYVDDDDGGGDDGDDGDGDETMEAFINYPAALVSLWTR